MRLPIGELRLLFAYEWFIFYIRKAFMTLISLFW
jgi:hypothetical protein